MLLAHHPDAVAALRFPTAEDPLRLLVSGCLARWPCGVDGTDYGMGEVVADILGAPQVAAFPFCPEQHALGVPRTMPDIHGGDGFVVLGGAARVLDEHGHDLTDAMIEGARAMLEFARAHQVELALLTDMSAACGSQVISDGCRLKEARSYQWGVGVATATLLDAGIPVVSQRDLATLGVLRRRLDPDAKIDPRAVDHHRHPWVLENLPGTHPRRAFTSESDHAG